MKIPKGFELLTPLLRAFRICGSAGVRLTAKRPMIELGPDGELIGIRFNNRSAAAFATFPLRTWRLTTPPIAVLRNSSKIPRWK